MSLPQLACGYTRCARVTLALLAASLLGALLPRTALAGGLYINDRGARQLGRGGAFVAGADDGQSLWYNPAGLSYAGRQLHLDGTLTFFRGSFTRQVPEGDLSYGQDGRAPTVNAETVKLPVPHVAYTDPFGLDDWNFGLALLAPNALITSFPETVTTSDGRVVPAPQRYSLISMEGSALASLALGVSWHGIEGLSLGASAHLVYVDRFRVATVMRACDGVLCLPAENPEWDAPAVLDLRHEIAFTGNIGAIYEWDMFRFGASLMFPYKVEGDANLDVQLPDTAFFENADVVDAEGSCDNQPCTAKVALDFPLILRVGTEMRPLDGLRVEADFVWERWSTQRELALNPNGLAIVNAEGLDRYDVGRVVVPRGMQDTYSMRLGGEYDLPFELPLVARAGILYENGAFPDDTLQVLTLDSDKVSLGLGASVKLFDSVWVDVTYGHIFLKDRNVTTSRVYPQNPIRPEQPSTDDPNDPSGSVPIGNGKYDMEADFIGMGLRWELDPPRRRAAASSEPAPAPAQEPEPQEPERETWDSWGDLDEG